MRVTVAYSAAPRAMFEEELSLPEGATVRDAVLASGIRQAFPHLDWEALAPGIWGRSVEWERTLLASDRVELCRPLLVDPKVARRERFRQQGARTTGLFKHRRKGGKAGY